MLLIIEELFALDYYKAKFIHTYATLLPTLIRLKVTRTVIKKFDVVI